MEATIETFWLIWNGSSNVPTRRHPTRESAALEIERLHAKETHVQEFFLMECVGSYKKASSPIIFQRAVPLVKKDT